jgi:hypothetical protein
MIRGTTLSNIAPHSYPYFFMAGMDSTRKVDRLWVVSENSAPAAVSYTHFNVVLGWSPADVDPGADPNFFALRALAYTVTPFGGIPYHELPVGTRTATSIDGFGITRWHSPQDGTYYLNVGEPSNTELAVRPGASFEASPSVVFPISLSPAPLETTTVDFATADGTATVADGDYVPVSGGVTFAPGDTVQYVTVALNDDPTPEPNETFHLVLSNPTVADILEGDAIGTILDDDDVTPPSVTVIAPNGGQIYPAGAIVPLRWSASDDILVARVDLRIKRGSSPVQVVANNVPNTGSYDWVATAPYATTARLLVFATDDRGNQDSDLSDADWSILDPIAVEPVPAVAFSLGATTPNPVSPRAAATIEYALPHEADVELVLIDVRGRRVQMIEQGIRQAGTHRAAISGRGLAPGLYFVRMTAPGFDAVRRVVVTS